MDQMTIKELVDAVIAELRQLGYKKFTIQSYEKIYADLIRYADEEHVTEYAIEFGEKYLKEVRGIDLCYVASGSDRSYNKYNKQNYLPIRVCQCLVEWKLHKLTSEDISAFFKTQIELDSRTVATMLTAIRVFFLHLYQTGSTRKLWSAPMKSLRRTWYPTGKPTRI